MSSITPFRNPPLDPSKTLFIRLSRPDQKSCFTVFDRDDDDVLCDLSMHDWTKGSIAIERIKTEEDDYGWIGWISFTREEFTEWKTTSYSSTRTTEPVLAKLELLEKEVTLKIARLLLDADGMHTRMGDQLTSVVFDPLELEKFYQLFIDADDTDTQSRLKNSADGVIQKAIQLISPPDSSTAKNLKFYAVQHDSMLREYRVMGSSEEKSQNAPIQQALQDYHRLPSRAFRTWQDAYFAKIRPRVELSDIAFQRRARGRTGAFGRHTEPVTDFEIAKEIFKMTLQAIEQANKIRDLTPLNKIRIAQGLLTLEPSKEQKSINALMKFLASLNETQKVFFIPELFEYTVEKLGRRDEGKELIERIKEAFVSKNNPTLQTLLNQALKLEENFGKKYLLLLIFTHIYDVHPPVSRKLSSDSDPCDAHSSGPVAGAGTGGGSSRRESKSEEERHNEEETHEKRTDELTSRVAAETTAELTPARLPLSTAPDGTRLSTDELDKNTVSDHPQPALAMAHLASNSTNDGKDSTVDRRLLANV